MLAAVAAGMFFGCIFAVADDSPLGALVLLAMGIYAAYKAGRIRPSPALRDYAAGKGGAIKRVAQALDARAYTIFPSPAPTKPELAHPFLWRYWTRLPKAGHVGIYDRSWYGRVLVERVEGFATDAQWARAYDEINEFEQELVRWGAVLLKFWVDVSQEEQLARFRARQEDPAKQWKITDEDWRNRDKYPQYKSAVEDMFRLTSTPFAPWIVLESDDKRFARVKALETINDALEARLHAE